MKMYNVLWIDDEPEKQDAFVESAFLEDINLINYEINIDGINKLKEDPSAFDGIILDAKGYEKTKDEKTGLSGLQNSIKEICTLSVKKPYFIFSAYLDMKEYGPARDLLKNEEIFTKGTDNQKLFNRIKEAADLQLDTQVRHENETLFKALEYFDFENNSTIIDILKAIKKGYSSLDDELYFTQLRIVLEQLFRKANEFGLLHDACVTVKGNQVNLTESSKFLSGLDCDWLKVRCKQTHFPKLIAEGVKDIIFITGAASHTVKVDITENIDVQAYRKEIKTPYLLYRLTFLLADVIIWFHQYLERNQDVDINKALWVNMDDPKEATNQVDLEGELEQDSKGNYYVGACVMPYLKVHEVYSLGTKIKILKSIKNEKNKPSIYPYLATRFEVI